MTIKELIAQELQQQQNSINLIASENYASREVQEAVGSFIFSKYAEGYPKKRYYAGCSVVDEIELQAIESAKKLFGYEHVNVQPHAGATANTCIFFALLKPGDTIVGMELSHGGHLTHGYKANMSGAWFTVHSYKVEKESELIDYEKLRQLCLEVKPRLLIVGASAYPRIIDFKRCGEIARECGAILLADISHIAGLVVTGLHPSPYPHADIIMTTTHKTLRGPRGAIIACNKEYASAIDRAVMPGMQGGPMMNVIAAKAIAFNEALTPQFVQYQKKVIENAQEMAAVCMERGYRVVTGGTDTHLFLVDVSPLKNSHGLDGKKAEKLLEQHGIFLNRNTLPYDTGTPLEPSGIRIGTPAMTTRGMNRETAREMAHLVLDILEGKLGDQEAKSKVQTIARAHSLFWKE